MSNHTPGPWHVRHCDDALHMNMTVVSCMDWGRHNSDQYQAEDDTICIVFHQMDPLVSDQLDDFGEANARLIACAPDLLEALEDIARGPLQGPPNFAAYAQNRAKAAVFAVKGETQEGR